MPAATQTAAWLNAKINRNPTPKAEAGKALVNFESLPGKKGPEAYELEIRTTSIHLRATTPAGWAHAAASLLQIMPAECLTAKPPAQFELPCLLISDEPEMSWRGIHVDVSRRFQDRATMLKLLDGMAFSKLNVLHWHLTDDQGWRLPIEGLPKLTEKGPAYSREDIAAVVSHAQALGITIVPEIDVPGHSAAAVAAYEEIGTKLPNGKTASVLNPAAKETYLFLEKVFADTAKQFPGPYIHMGADEVGMGAWSKNPLCMDLMKEKKMKKAHHLQTHFVSRVVEIIAKNNRKTIVWDEAFSDQLDPSVVVMSWRGSEPGIAAAEAGHQVVFCPVSRLYFDRTNSRSKNQNEGYSNNTVTLNTVYFYPPRPAKLLDAAKARILGAEGCVWGEKIKNADHMLAQVFPRGLALSENLWGKPESRNWESFLSRLEVQRLKLQAMGIKPFWEPESIAYTLASWGIKDGNKTQHNFPFSPKLPGLHEICVEHHFGANSFTVTAVELLKEGKVIAADRHIYDPTVPQRGPNQYYFLPVPSVDQGYSIRITVKPEGDGSAGTVQVIPPLPPEMYAPSRSPQSKANGSGTKQPDE